VRTLRSGRGYGTLAGLGKLTKKGNEEEGIMSKLADGAETGRQERLRCGKDSKKVDSAPRRGHSREWFSSLILNSPAAKGNGARKSRSSPGSLKKTYEKRVAARPGKKKKDLGVRNG